MSIFVPGARMRMSLLSGSGSAVHSQPPITNGTIDKQRHKRTRNFMDAPSAARALGF
jgi:hypothetical protein